MTVYNHDPAVELAQAESIVREWSPFTRDGEAICWVMVEYDRRGTELEELRGQRAAVLALADELEGDGTQGLLQAGPHRLAGRLRAAVGVEA